ncbi:MAG: UDP-N-acetylenolpyruvoylglucosamine reductase [Candidatus Magasanikbacteria bacterium GW2011_GWC2_41_17]|uniref:UDP-N-acetylenolpyruvoylglucosamine reductase n=1 Tax=Candidatus Magasanikbacteria bacterium GW2011_GWC2_41_17 TaxID=1619048 RepID=A0A0G0VF73_9BACT|nr:MAG: UDP-N-acetylenolpyruvoylglucosamine reductase [Candidatus Magasanikbacteria bacterium GW2011_GWC2_41_17]
MIIMLNINIQENIPLAPLTTFKIGGSARFFVEVSTAEEIIQAKKFAQEKNLPILFFGGGSNVLINDEGFPGLVVRIIKGGWTINGNQIFVGTSVYMVALAFMASRHGLRGLEWAGGLPGTLGGAIRGNAGAFRFEISQNIKSVEVLRGDQIIHLRPEECGFGYRTSWFKNKLKDDIILSANLELAVGDAKESEKQLQDFLIHRQAHQPQHPSAGCIFKNFSFIDMADIIELKDIVPSEFLKYKKIPAAWIVEHAGMKGAQVGQAQVSTIHANFIVNLGGAKAIDVLTIIRQIKEKVYNKFHIKLEEEVQII